MHRIVRSGRLCASAVIALCGCQNSAQLTPPDLAPPAIPTPAPPPLVVESEVTIPSGVPPSNAVRVTAPEFYPPGKLEILERRELPSRISMYPSARFPSNSICLARSGRRALRCETREIAGALQHVLLLEDRPDGSAFPVWQTDRPFDVVWAPFGDLAAITHWLGENRSEVLVLFSHFRKVYLLPQVHPSDLSPFLSKAQLDGPWMFRALGWAGETLVVRGAGYDALGREFGSEFTVNFQKASDPSYPPWLVRAYLRAPR